jgi:adenosine deaminase CECR1
MLVAVQLGKVGTHNAAKIICLCLCWSALGADNFADQFERIKKNASKEQLFTLLYDLPKGGDLHHHLVLSNLAESWYEAATDIRRTHGNEFYTLTHFRDCPDNAEPLLRFRMIQRSTYRKLSECVKSEYESLARLTPEARQDWISAMILDKEGEGRNEFFEVINRRLVELFRDPYLATDLLAVNLKRYGAQGLRYLETQMGVSNYQDQEGSPIDSERIAQMFRERLSQPDVKVMGITVRFLITIIRFAPNAEENLKKAYDFVDRHRDLWVGINMAGREDNDKGYALRFLDTYREMRRKYSGIQLSIHGGEKDSPGREVRDTLLLGATRIGHGVNLITDPDTMLLMRNGKNLVEINLISNRLLEYTPDLTKHPFPEYLRFGIPVCLNTDDAGVWDSDIVDEYYTAVKTFNLTWPEIMRMGRDSLAYSFAQSDVKEQMLRDYDAAVRKFEKKYNGTDWPSALNGVKPVSSGYAGRNFQISFPAR